MKYQIFQKTDGGQYILLGRAIENVEDEEVYLSYKNGDTKAFSTWEFFNIFDKPFFVLVDTDKPAKPVMV
jgi:hypothetical protein